MGVELLELDPERLLDGGWRGQALLARWVEPQRLGLHCGAAPGRDSGARCVDLPLGELALVQLGRVAAEHDHALQAAPPKGST